MSQSPEQWFDLATLGFPGWEHTRAFRVTTNTRGGRGPMWLEVRMQSASFIARLFDDGRGTFAVVKDHIEGVEGLIAKQDLVAA
jgi:hypothetical protein